MTQVLDAATLRLDDGGELRLAGVWAPSPPDSASDTASWPPAEDARAALEALVLGRSIEIAFVGPRQDRYGRLVGHVFAVEGSRRTWVQGALLAAGHARVLELSERPACLDELMSHERIAFVAAQGLWANAAYQVRQAHDTIALMRYRNTLQIVEGIVAEVAAIKGRIFLNFGAD